MLTLVKPGDHPAEGLEMEIFLMMIPNLNRVLAEMATSDIDSASALAAKAKIAPGSARKVLRGDRVSLAVAQKSTRAICRGRAVTQSPDLLDLFTPVTVFEEATE